MNRLLLVSIYLTISNILNAANPIVPRMGHGDPHIRIFNNKVYVYVSHDIDSTANGFIMQNWYVLTSEDMINWDVKRILEEKNTYIKRSSNNCWAVDAEQRNGKYYLYFSEWNNQVGVAVCDSPDGTFVDALNAPLLPSSITPTREYDPAVFIDDDNHHTPYIVFGGPKWAYGDSGDDYYIGKLNDDMVSLAETPRKLIVNNGVDDKPSLHRYKDTYYLSWASHYATAENVYGPYTYRGNIKASQDHGSFVHWNNQWFNAFTIFDPSVFYRSTGLTYIHYRDNGEIADIDPLIKSYGVGQYEASWDRIEAEMYMAASNGSIKREMSNGDFEIHSNGSAEWFKYPNVHNVRQNTTIQLKVKSPDGGKIIIEDFVLGKKLGEIKLLRATDYYDVSIRLKNPIGDNNIIIKISKNISIDNFCFK